ncbi:MAG: HAD hydrolase family protein, partial [Armatimonadetes bacterium]|nr:HAD hydrolase family protein [Anaerolineae bacterium]
NDIEMIQLVGIGVAMGNANAKLKAVADYVVASNDQDGVAEAIERFVLKKDEPQPVPLPLASTIAETTASDAALSTTEAPAEPVPAQPTSEQGNEQA